MFTTQIGDKAEQKAAEYLDRNGYAILERNWRRRDCEIDIVAELADTVYFIEVKYRSSGNSGEGLEYITRSKLRRMAYGANRWVQEHNWIGEFRIAALEVSGSSYEVTAYVDDIYDIT